MFWDLFRSLETWWCQTCSSQNHSSFPFATSNLFWWFLYFTTLNTFYHPKTPLNQKINPCHVFHGPGVKQWGAELSLSDQLRHHNKTELMCAAQSETDGLLPPLQRKANHRGQKRKEKMKRKKERKRERVECQAHANCFYFKELSCFQTDLRKLVQKWPKNKARSQLTLTDNTHRQRERDRTHRRTLTHLQTHRHNDNIHTHIVM